jgi:protein-S-isoprenylcysteine O-methyltransferase Ste14
MMIKFVVLRKTILNWGWGLLFLVSLLLGEYFVNPDRNNLIVIIGLFFLLFGVILVPIPFLLFPIKGEVPQGENFLRTIVIVESGIYGCVRHPQYLGWGLIIFSFLLIRQNFIITAIGSISLFLLYLSTIEEERGLIDRFGSDYMKYMMDVPRWNVLLGLLKRFSKRRG